MTIERRIYGTAGIIILFVLIIGSILLWNSREVEDGIDQIGTSSQVVRSAFLLRVLMDEHLAHGDKRSLRQWNKRNEFLGKIINDAKGFKSIDRALLKELEIKYQAVNSFHPQVVRAGTSENHGRDSRALKETLAGMMSVRLEELANTAEVLHRDSQSLTLKKQRLTQTLILAASLLAIGIIALNLYLVKKSIVSPLQELSNGAEIIGTGNFEHVVVPKTKDEVGKLAQSFNTMVERLKTIHNSLRDEMTERRRVQEELRQINEDLEIRVHDRTMALTKARDELELRMEERTAALQTVRAQNQLLMSVQRAQGQFITDKDPVRLFNELLHDLLVLTDSEFGFIGEILYTDDGRMYLRDRAITDISWDEESRKVYQRFAKDKGSDFHDIRGLWGAVILTGEPVISNDPANDPRHDGLPEGHPPLLSFLGIPFHSGGELLGMAGIANRPGGYDEQLVDFLQPYVATGANIIEAYRNEDRRKIAESALRLSELRYRSIGELIPYGVWVCGRDGKVEFLSDNFLEMIGTTLQDFKQGDWVDRLPPETVEKTASDWAHCIQTGGTWDYEYRIRDKHGEYKAILSRGMPLRDDAGQVMSWAGINLDITERKRAEDALRLAHAELESRVQERTMDLHLSNAELERSNAELQQFAYVASHDLQEPLRNVASCLQLLEKKCKDKLDAEADEYIHYAVEAAARMRVLIMDLLAYSRIATKGKPPEWIDCEDILDQTAKNLGSAIAETGTVITHDPLPTVAADTTQLVQVFQNLIGNAIKFCKDSPPRVHVSAVKNKDKDEWIFSVKDNGIGIEARHLDRIFVIFQRLHKRSEYPGTGMGLAIVKKVVERHRGRVWVESQPGAGSTFYFTIPDKDLQA